MSERCDSSQVLCSFIGSTTIIGSFILSKGIRIQIDFVMRPRSSSRRRNTSALVTIMCNGLCLVAGPQC